MAQEWGLSNAELSAQLHAHNQRVLDTLAFLGASQRPAKVQTEPVPDSVPTTAQCSREVDDGIARLDPLPTTVDKEGNARETEAANEKEGKEVELERQTNGSDQSHPQKELEEEEGEKRMEEEEEEEEIIEVGRMAGTKPKPSHEEIVLSDSSEPRPHSSASTKSFDIFVPRDKAEERGGDERREAAVERSGMEGERERGMEGGLRCLDLAEANLALSAIRIPVRHPFLNGSKDSDSDRDSEESRPPEPKRKRPSKKAKTAASSDGREVEAAKENNSGSRPQRRAPQAKKNAIRGEWAQTHSPSPTPTPPTPPPRQRRTASPAPSTSTAPPSQSQPSPTRRKKATNDAIDADAATSSSASYFSPKVTKVLVKKRLPDGKLLMMDASWLGSGAKRSPAPGSETRAIKSKARSIAMAKAAAKLKGDEKTSVVRPSTQQRANELRERARLRFHEPGLPSPRNVHCRPLKAYMRYARVDEVQAGKNSNSIPLPPVSALIQRSAHPSQTPTKVGPVPKPPQPPPSQSQMPTSLSPIPTPLSAPPQVSPHGHDYSNVTPSTGPTNSQADPAIPICPTPPPLPNMPTILKQL